ncbi:hypothetical protein SAMN04488047_14213 [Tranquillimonas alkanivorans]|uniref:Uncharacterized protein n=1 Tax=Tranquillimonas alkanivorans TaxID=441119 RepID=A0A1I5W9Y1_9RHOB|nr:hypothetical protein SAMN04488047_14213 [Tranquillimonas alkanivorans]
MESGYQERHFQALQGVQNFSNDEGIKSLP